MSHDRSFLSPPSFFNPNQQLGYSLSYLCTSTVKYDGTPHNPMVIKAPLKSPSSLSSFTQ
jgi:hypothetical protein